jgi:hypothetical protein
MTGVKTAAIMYWDAENDSYYAFFMDRKSKEIISAVSVALILVAVSYWQAKWPASVGFLARVIVIGVWLIAVVVRMLVKVKD